MHDNKPKPLPTFTQSDIDRFWSKVIKGTPEECWPWTGSCSRSMYARFWAQGQPVIASRLALFLGTGVDPAPLLARHKCDNPWCVNPNHLIPGTHKDNTADSIVRKRRPVGVGAANAKLNDELVKAILRDRMAGISIPSLCQKYDVSQGAIIPIIKGKTWKHVIGPREPQKRQLTRERREEIRKRAAEGGLTRLQLAQEFGLSVGAVRMLINGRSWRGDGQEA